MTLRYIFRLLIILIFVLQNPDLNAQNAIDSAKIEYENRITKDTISGVYIPKDIDDCLDQLDKILSDSLKTEIRKMTENEFTSRAHLSLGMWLRNSWGLWAGSRLQVYLLNLKLDHPDGMSHFILSCYYKRLQGNKIHLKREIKRYREEYRAHTDEPKTKITAKTIDKKVFKDLDSAYLFADNIVEISFQYIDKLPNKIIKFKNIRSIGIENCQNLNWEKSFKLISRFSDLTKLSLFQNQVNSFPDGIGTLTNLSTLWIGNDSILALPETISGLKNLKNLMISECPKIDLSILFKQLADLDSLSDLDLSGNSLRTIPIEINRLQQLENLWLDDNLLTEIPKGIKELKNLTYLRLFNNKIKILDIKKGDLPNLTGIDLCYNELTEFPDDLTKLENLENIVMWYNEIENIPNGISDLVNLKRLNLQHNKIRNLPIDFCNLHRLEKFEFDNNSLNDSVFNTLVLLNQLKAVELDNNNISQIPDNIYLLINVESLGLSGNSEIRILPLNLSKLIKLESLGLGNCPNIDFNNVCNVLKGMELKQLGFFRNNLSTENKQKLNELLPKTTIYY